jgi:NAD(P)-dependent dehydrogenase (short-subunit alcohol dehydrogenase family)
VPGPPDARERRRPRAAGGPRLSAAFLEQLFGLAGRAALVTGARQGIGEAIAEGLARAGANVAVTSRDGAALDPVVASLERHGVRALPLELELADAGQVEARVAETVAAFGRLDIVVNNAALSVRGDSLDYDLADWDRVFATNLRGAFLVSRAAARVMRDRGGGRIVNLSSPFARVGLPGRAAYSASKAGLEQLTRSLAVEWAPYGITVNAVATTTVLTETREELFRDEAVLAERVAQIPLGRLGRPEDLVGAILFLCGDAGSFVTGEALLVDGGYTVRRA